MPGHFDCPGNRLHRQPGRLVGSTGARAHLRPVDPYPGGSRGVHPWTPFKEGESRPTVTERWKLLDHRRAR